VPINHPFVDLIGTNFNRNDYSTNRCLFNYNGVLYCYVSDNIDLLTSFKNNLKVLQCFQLQKLENTKINNGGDIFTLFVLGKNGTIYFCVLNGKRLITHKPKTVTENEKIFATNGPRNFIFLFNSKGESCCIANISNNELDIVIY
jgi:hypothetical protein